MQSLLDISGALIVLLWVVCLTALVSSKVRKLFGGSRRVALMFLLALVVAMVPIVQRSNALRLEHLRQTDTQGYLDELRRLRRDEEWLRALEQFAPAQYAAETQRRAEERDRAERARVEQEARRAAEARAREQQEAAERAAEEQRRIRDGHLLAAQLDCREQVTTRARFPSRVSFPWFDSDSRVVAGTAIVRGRVELLNGLGNMIPHVYQCSYDLSVGRPRLLNVVVNPG